MSTTTQIELPIARPETPEPDGLPEPLAETVELETPEAVRTPAIERPTPRGGPAATELKYLPKWAKRIALFSGGIDSLAVTILAMEEQDADCVVYLDTNTGLAENLEYVREICEDMGWPLYVAESPVELVTIYQRYGPFGPQGHAWAYNYLKERQLASISRHINSTPLLFSGVREDESDRRKVNVTAEVQWETNSWNGWWVSLLWDKSKDDAKALIDDYDLRTNPLYEKIGRSGDCWCLAYGGWDEIYSSLLALSDPDDRDPRLAEHGSWLLNVQTRVQEYRGRLELVRDRYPDTFDTMNHIRKGQRPHPSRIQVLKQHFPSIYDEVVSESIRTAVRRAKREPENWIGHGGASSAELRKVMAEHDDRQARLCEGCQKESSCEI